MGGSERHCCERDRSAALSPKTGLAGQARGKLRLAAPGCAAIGLAALTLGGCGDHSGETKDCSEAARASSISGFCVPRYVSLKRDTVNARKGPGTDYDTLWIYRAKGMPVQVVGETLDWRRICDPQGGAVWVHRSMVDGRRTVEALGPALLPILKAPREGSPVQGLLRPRALAGLEACKGAWCRVTVGGVSGWAVASGLWGVTPTAQCH